MLVTLTKLIAPVVPFVSETLYQNLVVRGASLPRKRAEESVHLTDYPQADESLIDSELSAEMNALLKLVSLGSALRNQVKIKVRQPLAELVVQPGSDVERRAVERFSGQIIEELNIKKVRLHDPAAGPLLSFEYKLNPKVAGPKFGPRLAEVQAALNKLDAQSKSMVSQELSELFAAGKSVMLTLADRTNVTVDPGDVWILPKTDKGFAGLADRGTQMLLDARISPELAREGMAREVVRQVQNCRKEAALNMEDRIALYLGADGKLAEAIAEHKDYIAAETLVAQWSEALLGGGAFHIEVKVEGQSLIIELRKAS